MIQIQFPKQSVKVREQSGIHEIFDAVRKKWLVLTPEEWVRQHFIQFLLQVKYYPAGLISVEKEIQVGQLKKRCDIVIYDRNMQPWMIIECKEMKVSLNTKTIDQILRYHSTLVCDYLVITNGSYTNVFKKEKDQFFQTDLFPEYIG